MTLSFHHLHVANTRVLAVWEAFTCQCVQLICQVVTQSDWHSLAAFEPLRQLIRASAEPRIINPEGWKLRSPLRRSGWTRLLRALLEMILNLDHAPLLARHCNFLQEGQRGQGGLAPAPVLKLVHSDAAQPCTCAGCQATCRSVAARPANSFCKE